MDKYIGRLLDNRYEILEIIGTGGMAVVYKARCHRLNRLVAIKILKDDYLEDEDFRSRFHSESQAVAMLSHPNIVSVYDVSTSVSLEADYIVMELIEGISLKQYMEKKKFLNWKETLHFAIQIAKALQHAHSRGIVHRDIKPHNIMVLKNGSVKVTDFGIARLMSQGNTLTKEALGSVHYISPEQAKGGRVDDRSDLYSLGVVMYEMMCGRPPYDGDSPVAVAIQHINGGAVMPSTINANIPGGLEQIIMKAMANEPSKRYSSATQMLQDMDEFRKEPAILFDYNVPPLDAVTRMPKEPQVIPMPGTTTAERVAGRSQTSRSTGRTPSTTGRTSSSTGRTPSTTGKISSSTGRSGSTTGRTSSSTGRASSAAGRSTSSTGRSSTSSQRKSAPREEERNWVAIIAIIICALALVVAVIFLLISCDGQKPEETPMIEAPAVVGEYYEDLAAKYPNVKFILADEIYDDTKPAGMILEQDPLPGTQIQEDQQIVLVVSSGPAPIELPMPNLQNYKQEDAQNLLSSKDIELDVTILVETSEDVKEGYVIRTEPDAGEILRDGSKVVLHVSAGREIRTASMPDLINATQENAEKTLDNQQLALNIKIEEIFDSVVAKGRVVKTEPSVGSKIKTGEEVTLFISKGPEMKFMPNLVDMDITNAYDVLKRAGFVKTPVIEYDFSDTIEKDRVMLQSEEANTELDVNTEITLTISKGPQPPTPTAQTVTIAVAPPAGLEPGSNYDADLVTGGETVRIVTLSAEQTTVDVTVEGVGTMTYELYYNGGLIGSVTVEFSANG